MEYDYFDFNSSEIPSESIVTLDGQDYLLRIYQNVANDAIYVDLKDENGVELVMGERLVYGMALWSTITDPRLPRVDLIPLDPDNNETNVDVANFPDIVHLYIANTEPSDDDADIDNANNASDNDISDYGTDETVGDGL